MEIETQQSSGRDLKKKGKESGNMVLLMNGEVNGNCWASRIPLNGKDEDRVYISDQLF